MDSEGLSLAINDESKKFRDYYLWLEKAMPPDFFKEISRENIMLIVHNLMGFNLQVYFSTIHLKNAALVLSLDSADADLRILKDYAFYGIKDYQAYVSNTPPPFPNIKANLRVAAISFTEAVEVPKDLFSLEAKNLLKKSLGEHKLTDSDFDKIISSVSSRFLKELPVDRLVLAFNMFFRAQTRDNCQYEVRYNEKWEETGAASMQIVLAWRNAPKHNFLYRMARVIHRHQLVMKRVNASYINAYEKESTLLMALDLHGNNGQAAWEAANIVDFLRELLTVKYFASFDPIDDALVSTGTISGSMGNFLRSATNFIHQILVHVDANIYTIEHIQEAFCRHPKLTAMLCEVFRVKFDPNFRDYEKSLKMRDEFLADVDKLDTGQEDNDIRRKNILRQAMNFIVHTLKTNFFRINITAHSFRLDPRYLNYVPFDRTKIFPELPYAIFFIKGMHFFSFHIRFKDLSRGGLRTVYPHNMEQITHERNHIFAECYNLALTQHMKNKDIPEGGAKGVIFLNPFHRLESESLVLQNELSASNTPQEEIDRKIALFIKEQRLEHLHEAQRSFVDNLLVLVNCNPDGTLRAKNIVDYWKLPEYLYLGPDENMHDEIIQWIANTSKHYDYRPGTAFISGKPEAGINHKEYGVTSLGVNVYMEALLRFLGIDPLTMPFTIKMSGGPDGDVAGNEIHNLYRYYNGRAKLLTTIDVSGTIYDPKGLDLEILDRLFREGKPLRYYPPEKLNDGGFLLDKNTKRNQNALTQQALCWRKVNGKLQEDWVSGSEMNHILRSTVHQTKTDIFIPSGGRPRTLDESNIKEFLDSHGNPTSKGIVEGANLYLTPKARRFLEKLGVLVIKDSSANKTGVICSSFEILCGLTITDEEFLIHKQQLVTEILERLKQCASREVELLLKTHQETGQYLTDISQQISERIIQYTYELLDYLETIDWSYDCTNPITRSYLDYCLPLIRSQFEEDALHRVPDSHKKAVVACHLASQLVYTKGLSWHPTIVDILPLLL